MKTISDYSIYCTEEQTRKALELGAPLNSCYHNDDFQNTIKIGSLHYVEIPTAEQMIGWLEEQEGIRSIEVTESFGWHYRIKKKHDDVENWIQGNCKTRKESTLAAIDAALGYLIGNNLNQ